jgi:hypothetical protein
VDALVMTPGAFPVLVASGAVVLVLVARGWSRALRSLELGPHLALFAALALLPQASAPPSDRLLYVPALGLAPITALWLVAALGRERARRVRVGAWLVLLSALPLSGLVLVARGLFMGGVARDLNRVFLEAELEPAPAERRDVLLLSTPSVLVALGPLAGWRFHHDEPNTRFHALQFGRRGLRWTRLDERTFELESLDEPFLASLFEGVFRAGTPLARGQRFRTSAFELELLDGAPRGLRLSTEQALEDPRYAFLAWIDGRWKRLEPPAIGAELRLETGQPLRPMLP